ncbi:LiaI-LiaF-like domain-containing protein [Pseudobacteroides cellulosolvens]|uniref:LiaI-LiaF-like transmembrane region domain-containing protein n=1 Tax=Pseudobacteroides cellulosolvens ATCC 35603 = DSM 2933 TaxID=398512 RepID=A0A0L6JRY6_9FIRM|nr:DUF5668 domain-containing protein [Pseudobacteroides cellulosolvens]KNY28601.1 hypothetical protein Bccel_3875 [Pseudobacteroides cellulosolvens ATCC 35603 = DSM 2933]
MKTEKIGFGVFLLAVGVIWILVSFNVISFNYITAFFASFIKLWPLILIVVGLNLVFKYNSALKLVSWVLYFAILISYGVIANPKLGFEGVKIDLHLGDKIDKDHIKYSQKLNEATKNGKFDISLGAAKINIGGKTENLFDADVPKSVKLKKTDYSSDNSKAEIYFGKNDDFDFRNQESSFRLNKDLIWDVNVKSDVLTGKLDMTDLKIKKLDLDVKASSVDMIFGSGYDKTNAEIDAKASNINITVPKNSGVRIIISGKLNNTNLDKLEWNNDKNVYESSNYDKAESKIDMEMDMDVSNLKVYLID